jgi:hypothetical protein
MAAKKKKLTPTEEKTKERQLSSRLPSSPANPLFFLV